MGTVSIAMPLGLDFIYVETLRTTDAVPHVPDVGFTGTLATTAVGRSLLSLYTKDELDAHVARVKAERPEEADYVQTRTLPDIELCKERGFAVSLGEWRREIFGVAAPLYRTPTGDCLSVNCGIPRFVSAPSRSSANAGRVSSASRAVSGRWWLTAKRLAHGANASLERRGTNGRGECAGSTPA